MAANGMSNPNFLSVGQELIIPIEGAPETAVDTAEESSDIRAEDVLPTPIPTEPAGEGEAIIEIAEVVSAGELSSEAVQIVNNGGSETTLSDWKLADQFGNYYTFGPITCSAMARAFSSIRRKVRTAQQISIGEKMVRVGIVVIW